MEFNGLVPELSVSDLNLAKKFYLGILGFKLEYERIDDKFAFISFEDAQFMLEEVNGHWKTGNLEYPFGRGVNFQIHIRDLNPLLERLKQNEIKLFKDLMESRYEGNGIVYVEKEILVQDPDGYLLRFSQTVKEAMIPASKEIIY